MTRCALAVDSSYFSVLLVLSPPILEMKVLEVGVEQEEINWCRDPDESVVLRD